MSVQGRAAAPAVALEADPRTEDSVAVAALKTLSSEGAASVSALWRLQALFSSQCSSLFCSAVLTADLVVCC